MLTPDQIENLNKWIKDAYGSPEELTKQLENLVFMLHFLEEEVFTKREIQSAAELLKGFGEVLGNAKSQ
ncbi:hypothetical protein [Flagellimonas onchidii]|uniref:hypothetical protein n=1 Tax=Flagellimonas onchidii TaxID=2562684 RepID=UPI0010A5CF96|nr:hypothetical protein [Allomuricauda onchidii]